MAGLSCARRLAEAGIQSTILDKGRGLGGRLATRRTDNGLQFDHGAQYVTGRDASFRSLLAEMEEAGCCGRWTVEGKERAVGAPGMNTMAKHLARGLEIRQRAEVSGLRQTANGWEVSIAGQRMHFARTRCDHPGASGRRPAGSNARTFTASFLRAHVAMPDIDGSFRIRCARAICNTARSRRSNRMDCSRQLQARPDDRSLLGCAGRAELERRTLGSRPCRYS